MENNMIRTYAKNHGVSLWQLADRLGISENTIGRRLRRPLTKDDEILYIHTIDQIVSERMT